MVSLLFYLSIFLVIFIISYIGSIFYKKNKKIGNFIIILSFLVMLIIFGFRYKVGTDYETYLTYYNTIKFSSWSNLFLLKWEKGALVFFKLVSMLFNKPYIIFIIISFLQLYPIYKMNKLYEFKYLPYSLLCFLTLYMPFFMNGMRQGIAMSFSLYSFSLLMHKNYKKSFFVILIGILFHKTALLLLPFIILYIFIKNKNYSKCSFILSIFLSIIILFFLKDFFIENDISTYSSYLDDINVSKISIKPILWYIPSIIIIFLFGKKDIIFRNYNGLFLSGVLFNIIGTSAHYLNRISYYFTFFEIILIPYLICNIKDEKSKKIVKLIYIIYLIIYFIYQFYISGKNEIFPYKIINF